MPARFLILYGDRRFAEDALDARSARANLLYRRGPTVCASAYGRATSLAYGITRTTNGSPWKPDTPTEWIDEFGLTLLAVAPKIRLLPDTQKR